MFPHLGYRSVDDKNVRIQRALLRRQALLDQLQVGNDSDIDWSTIRINVLSQR